MLRRSKQRIRQLLAEREQQSRRIKDLEFELQLRNRKNVDRIIESYFSMHNPLDGIKREKRESNNDMEILTAKNPQSSTSEFNHHDSGHATHKWINSYEQGCNEPFTRGIENTTIDTNVIYMSIYQVL